MPRFDFKILKWKAYKHMHGGRGRGVVHEGWGGRGIRWGKDRERQRDGERQRQQEREWVFCICIYIYICLYSVKCCHIKKGSSLLCFLVAVVLFCLVLCC